MDNCVELRDQKPILVALLAEHGLQTKTPPHDAWGPRPETRRWELKSYLCHFLAVHLGHTT